MSDNILTGTLIRHPKKRVHFGASFVDLAVLQNLVPKFLDPIATAERKKKLMANVPAPLGGGTPSGSAGPTQAPVNPLIVHLGIHGSYGGIR